MTHAQQKILDAAAKHPFGYAPTLCTNNGLGSASRRRMMNRLILAGLFFENAHREYEITEAGRAKAKK